MIFVIHTERLFIGDKPFLSIFDTEEAYQEALIRIKENPSVVSIKKVDYQEAIDTFSEDYYLRGKNGHLVGAHGFINYFDGDEHFPEQERQEIFDTIRDVVYLNRKGIQIIDFNYEQLKEYFQNK